VVVTSALLVLAVIAGRGLGSEGWLTEVVGQPLSAVWSTFVVASCVADLPTGEWWRRASATTRRVLATRPLVAIGKYSYAVYVFHLPVHHIIGPTFAGALEQGSSTRRLAAHAAYSMLVFVISAIIARISWTLIERPFLSLKRFVPMAESPDTTRIGETGLVSDVAEGRA
jgi:peptidoglycan/LPS O-acetylase OafA/YrhL